MSTLRKIRMGGLTALTAAGLVLAGCTQDTEQVEAQPEVVEEATEAAEETVEPINADLDPEVDYTYALVHDDREAPWVEGWIISDETIQVHSTNCEDGPKTAHIEANGDLFDDGTIEWSGTFPRKPQFAPSIVKRVDPDSITLVGARERATSDVAGAEAELAELCALVGNTPSDGGGDER